MKCLILLIHRVTATCLANAGVDAINAAVNWLPSVEHNRFHAIIAVYDLWGSLCPDILNGIGVSMDAAQHNLGDAETTSARHCSRELDCYAGRGKTTPNRGTPWP